MENKPAQNIQDTFLNTVRKDKTPITIYLVSGVKLTGKIRSFDKYSVLLENNSQEQLIFKHAISTVVSNRSVLHSEHRPSAVPTGIGLGPSVVPAAPPASAETRSGLVCQGYRVACRPRRQALAAGINRLNGRSWWAWTLGSARAPTARGRPLRGWRPLPFPKVWSPAGTRLHPALKISLARPALRSRQAPRRPSMRTSRWPSFASWC